jgi:4'-phosphopantetheinyl transferase
MCGGMPERLGPDEVRLWRVRVEEVRDADTLARFYESLDQDERERLARMATAALRHLFLVSHGLVRTMLSGFAGAAPGDWHFERNQWGAPHIAGPAGEPPLHFSLSHTRGWAVCAVSLDREVGADVEAVREGTDVLEIAGRFFSPAEAAELAATPEQHRKDRFAALWTLKEAYIKAQGRGLAVPLSSFTVEFGEQEPRLVGGDSGQWRFWSRSLGKGCRQAVAARRRARERLAICETEGGEFRWNGQYHLL